MWHSTTGAARIPHLGGKHPIRPMSTSQRQARRRHNQRGDPLIDSSQPVQNRRATSIKQFTNQKFFPSSEKYVSPAPKGRVTFDYSNNNGRYCIGSAELMFETRWSKASDRNIHLLNDPSSIHTVAVVKDKKEIAEIADARIYDGSSKIRRPNVGQIAVLQNANGFWAAIKILRIRDDTRNDDCDEVSFDYVIQTNGTPCFIG